MMNNARLAVGLQGVAIAERAYQQALAYAQERRQGRAPGALGDGMSPIVEHPDVQRMLLTMKALTAAARAICYLTAEAIDRAHLDRATRTARGTRSERASLLTPVAKAFSTDIGVEVASLGVQVHGGMGFIEETGAAQHLRDARILPIYEGTNGIQAIDLVTRKLPLVAAARPCARADRARCARPCSASSRRRRRPSADRRAAARGVESLDRATSFLLKADRGNAPDEALAGATPYLRLFGLAQGGAGARRGGARGERGDRRRATPIPRIPARIALCRFFAENLATAARGLEESVLAGAGFVEDAPLALAS